ncbi:MAG: fluoride efflux transporter CrcB [Stackebrandtia sp.]
MRFTLAAVALGGAVGALARYGLDWALPASAGGFPWGTWAANVSGCLLIGALTAWLAAKPAPRWVRPAIGIGLLGGYTTFSAYAVETANLLADGHARIALTYLLGTVAGALLAVYAGSRMTRAVLRS